MVAHLAPEKFKKDYPQLVNSTCLVDPSIKPNRVTYAEVTYDGLTSKATAIAHENDQFQRRKGAVLALSRALRQHSTFKGRESKDLRREVFAQMFRSEPSPYTELMELVDGRPDLARDLTKMGRAILNPKT